MHLDLFCGIRGWGTDGIGFDTCPDVVRTNGALGARMIRADVATWPLESLVGRVRGITASPPCQTFSAAGKNVGKHHRDALLAAVRNYAGDRLEIDGRTELVVEPLRWALALRPEWIACEQVPAVAPLWDAIAGRLSEIGYSAWSGVLNAADFGVPQTRRRAILIASRVRPVSAPVPTHAKEPGDATLLGEPLLPWVTMAEALGWTGRVGFPRRDDLGDSPDGYRVRDWRPATLPSVALTEKARSWKRQDDPESVKISVSDALTLQGFSADWPVQGSRTAQFRQVGNAVPPGLARAVLAAVEGVETRRA